MSLNLYFNPQQLSQLQSISDAIHQLYSTKEISGKYLDWISTNSYSIITKSTEPATSADPPHSVEVVINACRKLGIPALFFQVESDYYSWCLQTRCYRLNAPSVQHLCKSVIFENTHCTREDCEDVENSRYYCVIVQYVSKLNTQKLTNYVRDLKQRTISKKHYNMRVAAEEKSEELTGFGKNGVSPFGMTTNIPVIIDAGVSQLEPPTIYLGAGHVDWKTLVKVTDLTTSLNGSIVDLQ